MPSRTEADGIGIIMLAAGYSRRFDGDKRHAALRDGRTLLQATLSRVPDTFCEKLLVLHPGDETRPGSFSGDWSACTAERAKAGMGHSLAAGISSALHWRGAVIALADMPLVHPETYDGIRSRLCEHGIVVPVFRGQRGNPVGFGAEFFNQLSELSGDKGARHLLHAHADRVHAWACADDGILRDVDTREEMRQLV